MVIVYCFKLEKMLFTACYKIAQQRCMNLVSSTPTNSRPTTPQGSRLGTQSYNHQSSPTNGMLGSSTGSGGSGATLSIGSPNHLMSSNQLTVHNLTLPHRHHSLSSSTHHLPTKMTNDLLQVDKLSSNKWGTISHATSQQALLALTSENNNTQKLMPLNADLHFFDSEKMPPPKEKDMPTPTSTPTTSRKNRRRSNLFIPSSRKHEKQSNEMGSGRAIPIKQGYLYKKSNKTLNKEWKKKYVTLCDDGRLTYHPSLHDYMDDVHGKTISLQYVTVKVPGQKPRGSKSIITNSSILSKSNQVLFDSLGHLSITKDKSKPNEKVLLTGFEVLRDGSKSNHLASGDEAISNSNSQSFSGGDHGSKQDAQTPNVKKRHRRMKSSGIKNDGEDADTFEFIIVSLDNKQWHFEASSCDERDEWVSAIEQEIFKSLQGNESTKKKSVKSADVESLQTIRTRVPGNGFCVDCDTPSMALKKLFQFNPHYVLFFRS